MIKGSYDLTRREYEDTSLLRIEAKPQLSVMLLSRKKLIMQLYTELNNYFRHTKSNASTKIGCCLLFSCMSICFLLTKNKIIQEIIFVIMVVEEDWVLIG